MTPIRPDAFPPPLGQPGQAQRPDAARAAAQKAFFDAAMGRTAAPARATPLAVFTPATAPVQRPQLRPDPAAEAPAKVLRPGSLLDIRV